LIYHGTGHFNACFKLARTLQQQHQVAFAGVEFFTPYVTQQSFEYHPLKSVPFGIGLEYWFHTVRKNKPIYFHALKDRWADGLYQIREKELSNLIDQYRPDVIFLDAQQNTDFLVLYSRLKKSSIKIVLVHTMLPQEAPYLSGSKFARQKLVYFGMDDKAIIRRRQKKNQIPDQYISPRQSNLGCVLQNIDEVILAPREFELSAPVTSAQYIGFHPDYKRKEKYSADFNAFRDKVRAGAYAGKKFLYFSAGTILSHQEKILTLIRNLSRVSSQKGYVLVVTYPQVEKVKALTSHTDTVVFEKVPQLDVLSYADLFITHGGLNSIAESVLAGVPMLVFTPQNKMDLPMNAARVLHHNLGLKISLDESVLDLNVKINQVLTNPGFRQGIQQLRLMNGQYALDSIMPLENFRHL